MVADRRTQQSYFRAGPNQNATDLYSCYPAFNLRRLRLGYCSRSLLIWEMIARTRKITETPSRNSTVDVLVIYLHVNGPA